MENSALTINLFLGLGRALLCYISSSLRAAAVRLEDHPDKLLICVSLYFNGEISEEDRDDLDAALTEMVSSFVPDKEWFFDYTLFERRDFPLPLPNVGVYAFSRDTLLPRQIESQDMVSLCFYDSVLISAYQALLGRIPDSLRCAKISEHNGRFVWNFYLDENFTTANTKLLNQVVDAFIADFPGYTVNPFFRSWPYPKMLPQSGWSVFRRKEIAYDEE